MYAHAVPSCRKALFLINYIYIIKGWTIGELHTYWGNNIYIYINKDDNSVIGAA